MGLNRLIGYLYPVTDVWIYSYGLVIFFISSHSSELQVSMVCLAAHKWLYTDPDVIHSHAWPPGVNWKSIISQLNSFNNGFLYGGFKLKKFIFIFLHTLYVVYATLYIILFCFLYFIYFHTLFYIFLWVTPRRLRRRRFFNDDEDNDFDFNDRNSDLPIPPPPPNNISFVNPKLKLKTVIRKFWLIEIIVKSVWLYRSSFCLSSSKYKFSSLWLTAFGTNCG